MCIFFGHFFETERIPRPTVIVFVTQVQVSIERNQKFMEMKSEKKKLAQQVRNESSTIPEKLSGKRKHHEGASTKHELDPYELILNLKRQKTRNLISDDDHSEESEPSRKSKKSLIPSAREKSLEADANLFDREFKDELLSVPFNVYYNELKEMWQHKKSRFIPFDEETKSGLKIGAWCQYVMLVCDGIVENTFLEPHDFKRLLQISFFDYSGRRPSSFEHRVIELARHREKYGHCNIPPIYKNHYSLGLWCARIRTIAQRVSFPKERLSVLNKHGFVWDENEVKENDSVFNENHGPDSTNKSSKHEDSDDQMDYTNETDTAIENKSVSSGSKLKPIISKKELTELKSSGTFFCRRIMYNFGLTKFTVNDLHGKRRNLRIGHPGLACIHCDNVDSSAAFKHVGSIGRYFPSTIKTLSDTKKTLFTLYKHLQRCKHMDPQELEILAKLRKDHEAERSLQKHGSQKQFFVTIWDRLYKDNADHIVKGDILERNKGRFVAEKVIAHEGNSSLISVKNNKRKESSEETELMLDILGRNKM